MTRTARRQKKKFEEASSWNEMKTSSINKRYAKGRGSKVIDEKRQRMIERRRMRRAMAKVCFKCRQPFHKLDECPENKEEKICFKCGSSDHSIKECQVKLPTDSFPYAKCFICHETGHLSRSCPDNPKGLYPNGGGCRLCGSVEHFKANCPMKQRNKSSGFQHLASIGNGDMGSVDADTSNDINKKSRQVMKKLKKIVKF